MNKPSYLLEIDAEKSDQNYKTNDKRNSFDFNNPTIFPSSTTDEAEIVSDTLPKGEEGNSMLMTGFLMLNAMIGSGILNQPQVFAEAGIGAAIIMFTVAAVFIWLALVVLVECGITRGKFDYSELAFSIFGGRGEMIVDACISLGSFGATLSYLDIVGGTSSDLLYSWGCNSSGGCGAYLITALLTLIFILPLCSMRYFGHLAIFSVLSMTAILSCLFLVIIGGPIVGSNQRAAGFKSGAGVQLGSIIFTLNCSFAAFHSYKCMKDPTPEKWRTICGWIVLIGYIMCCAMGISGYLAFGDGVNGIILNNFTGHYADFFKILLVIHLILYIPVEFMIMRNSIIKLGGRKSGILPKFSQHFGLTIIILFLTAFIILLLRSAGFSQGNAFSIVLDFTGAITGSMISFILPGAFYVKVYSEKDKYYYYCAAMFIFGICVMIAVPILSVIGIVGR